MTVLSLTWDSPYLERRSLYWDRAQLFVDLNVMAEFMAGNQNICKKAEIIFLCYVHSFCYVQKGLFLILQNWMLKTNVAAWRKLHYYL